jgi:hypothetical protein
MISKMPCRIIIFSLLLLSYSCAQSQHGEEKNEDHSTLEWLSIPGQEDKPHIVLISGDEEYRSEEALPQLAGILNVHHGFSCTVLFAQDPDHPGIVDPNYVSNIPGLQVLEDADLVILFTRFRALPDDQMEKVNQYLLTGKPLIGIRTATHAFRFAGLDLETEWAHYGNFYEEEGPWDGGFGRFVLGEKWISHHGHHAHQSTRGVPVKGKENHSILHGIEAGTIWGPTDVYGVRLPLPGDSEPIVLGQVVERAGEFDDSDPLLGMSPQDDIPAAIVQRKEQDGQEVPVDLNDPMMPIAWIKSYQLPGGKSGKVFTSTLGASTDLLAEGSRRMLVNAAFWCLDLEVPRRAVVDLVGEYNPSRFAFHDDAYWDEKQLSIRELQQQLTEK